MADKENCKYWEKCYRKDKKHIADYLHPADVKKKDIDTNPKTSLRKQKTLELDDGGDAGKQAAAKSTDASPVKVRKRKTHEMSVCDDDDKSDEPPTKRVKTEKSVTEKKEVKKTVVKEEKPSTSAAGKKGPKRTRCQYWNKCYRKDLGHKKLYVHPGDPDEKDSVDANVRASGRTQPLHRLDSVDAVKVGGFTLKRTGSAYECTCSSFSGIENMGKAANEKTCSHLIGYLGEDFERSRCKLPPKGKHIPVPNHISVSVLLAHKYTEGDIDPTGWWMSEKLDGVRAYWNGRCFYSRLGNAFHAPAWFTKHLPKDMHLDGELFGGRKKFQSTVSIVKTPEHKEWNKIMYHVFDAPHMLKETFEKRMQAIKDCFTKIKPGFAKFVEHEKCRGQDHIDKELKRIIAIGGEGLMIREPGSLYEKRRSKTLLKIKKFHDAEAIVIGHEKSKSNPGLTGALVVKMANGKVFKVGSGLTNQNRRNPPKKGTIITYKFQEYSNSGSPRFPTFVGIRIDMTEPKDAEGVVIEGKDD